MKRIILAIAMLTLVLAACSPTPPSATPTTAPAALQPTPSTAPSATAPGQQLATKVTATAQANYPAPKTQAPTPTESAYTAPSTAASPTAGASPYPAAGTGQSLYNTLPAATRYGVVRVDAVLDALMSGTPDAISALIVYTKAPCTTKDGLGAPKCQDKETDGTVVEVLPSMGPEGSFLRKKSDNLTDLPGKVDLLGVFGVKSDFKSEPNYPSGKYSIVLLVKNSNNIVALRVSEDGIVREDFLQNIPDPSNQPDMESYLNPKS